MNKILILMTLLFVSFNLANGGDRVSKFWNDLSEPTQEMGFTPFVDHNHWLVVTPGAESGRRERHGKKVVAVSLVEVALSSDEDVETCLKYLQESDRRFEMALPASPYDWQSVRMKRDQHLVRFGVEWYEKDFFIDKKDAYTSSMHAGLFKSFHSSPDKFQVSHFWFDDAKKLFYPVEL